MGGMSCQVVWSQPWDGKAESVLRNALSSIGCALRELPSQQWDPDTATIGGIRDYQTSYVAPASGTWSSVMLHLDSLCAEPLASELSRVAGNAIVFMEYDQATWGYCILEKGSPRDRFWSVPETVDADPSECKGDVAVICALFDVSSESVAPYLRHPDAAVGFDSKAFEDDEFDLRDHWVRCDFMRRLGLTYPGPGRTDGGRHVHIVESQAPEGTRDTGEAAVNTPVSAYKKPWWRFW